MSNGSKPPEIADLWNYINHYSGAFLVVLAVIALPVWSFQLDKIGGKIKPSETAGIVTYPSNECVLAGVSGKPGEDLGRRIRCNIQFGAENATPYDNRFEFVEFEFPEFDRGTFERETAVLRSNASGMLVEISVKKKGTDNTPRVDDVKSFKLKWEVEAIN